MTNKISKYEFRKKFKADIGNTFYICHDIFEKHNPHKGCSKALESFLRFVNSYTNYPYSAPRQFIHSAKTLRKFELRSNLVINEGINYYENFQILLVKYNVESEIMYILTVNFNED